MGGNTCSSSSGTAKNQRHGVFPAECRRYLDGFFVANVEKGWNMQKQKLHLESKITCVFVHIILPRYFRRKNSGWVPGPGVPFAFFQPPAASMAGQSMPIHFNSSTSKHLFAKNQRHKDQWRHKGEITGGLWVHFFGWGARGKNRKSPQSPSLGPSPGL